MKTKLTEDLSMKKTNLLLVILILGSFMLSCGSNGILGLGIKDDLSQYRIKKTDKIGSGVLSEGLGLAAIERTPDDPDYGKPHFFIAVRAEGVTNVKIIIYDVDTGKPVEQLIVDDK